MDNAGTLVGRITVDDVMDVIEEEDMYKMAGTSEAEMERPSVLGIARTRLPWLLVGVLGSLLSGGVIQAFKVTLEGMFTLATFLPVIMAIGGSSGLQACTVTVRGLVTGQVSSGMVWRTVLREMGTAVLMGIVCGGLASGVAWVWFGQALIGVCVGVSIFLVICLAIGFGVATPLIFDRLDIDPAVASGPFITISNDILGVFIYLQMATLLMKIFV
ncbi:MAG: magnesium transporter [bacterium]|nr:magnesium transporter [bacterium]